MENFSNSKVQDNEKEISDTKTPSTKNSQQRPSKICIYYSNYEYCRYGNNCKFLHYRKKIQQNQYTPKQFAAQSTGLENFQSKSKSAPQVSDRKKIVAIRKERNLRTFNNQQMPRPCRYYKAGHCQNGNHCLYSHSFENDNSTFGTYMLLESNKNSVKHIPVVSNSKKKSIPVCQYFKRGFCSKGDKCKFYHQQKYTLNENREVSPEFVHTDSNKKISDYSNVGKKNLPQCENEESNYTGFLSVFGNDTITTNEMEKNYYQFQNGSVEQSKFINDLHKITYSNENKCQNIDQCSTKVSQHNCISSISTDFKDTNKNDHTGSDHTPLNASKVFILASISEKEILQLRHIEITQLKKRFPNLEVIEENTSFSFIFQPSDPDWPFDLKSLKLQITFPDAYPGDVCEISVVQTTDYIPEMLFRHLNKSICEWLSNRHKALVEFRQVELIFRPFLKWFDRNLEEIFNCGLKRVKLDEDAKETDIELVAFQDLIISPPETAFYDSTPTVENGSQMPEIYAEQENLEKEISQVSEQKKIQNTVTFSAQKLGVKVLFTNLDLMEGVAALSCTKISAMLQCIRCKTSCNIRSASNKNNTICCSKCSKSMECNFNPSILHQFSNVLGTMHLMECQVVDINLVECVFLVDCLNCSKQVPTSGIHYGQKQKLWCMFCNQKLTIGIGSVKFQASSSSFAATKTTDKITKKIEKRKDPLIKEESPLPQLGACKHYKKSNRWLRFPCCGRVYPCDICHEDKETNHEMKFASRMICGFCSKEQPYSKEKPCISCSSGMVAKAGSHWEGGKGCRNKVKMSRDDKHKFAGTCKTTSKKSQNSGNKKKK